MAQNTEQCHGHYDIEVGDLTSYAVDTIVNAANNDLILVGWLWSEKAEPEFGQ